MSDLTTLLKRIFKKKKVEISKKTTILTPYEPVTDIQRFEQCIEKTDTCWNWIGSQDRYGYGKFKINSKTSKAHRYIYEHTFGQFDSSLHVLHHCDNPRCVNPSHLFLGTNRDNVADRTAKNRNGITTRQLTESEKQSICLEAQKFSTRRLAEQHHVHISTIRRLLKNPRYSRFKRTND